jgi:hypothetical protein
MACPFRISIRDRDYPEIVRGFAQFFQKYWDSNLNQTMAVPYLKRLDAGFPPRRSGFASGQHVGFVVDKVALGQVFSEYFGFPCQSFHQFLHHHNHPGLAQ